MNEFLETVKMKLSYLVGVEPHYGNILGELAYFTFQKPLSEVEQTAVREYMAGVAPEYPHFEYSAKTAGYEVVFRTELNHLSVQLSRGK